MANQKQKKQGSYIGVGIALGVVLGLALNNIGVGIAIGLVLGASMGGFGTNKDSEKKDK